MSETANITSPIVEALKQMGWMAIRLNSGAARMGKRYIKLCPAGTPDIVAFKSDEPVWWIETKDERDLNRKGETASKQAEFRATVLALGHRHTRATCVDDVLAALTR
jgi:hypothetical protein